MPSPRSTATSRPDLGGVFEEIGPEALREGYVGLRVFPELVVASQSGVFKRVTAASRYASVDTTRANGGGYNRSLWQFEEDFYYTRENGIEEPIDEREERIYGDYFEAEVFAVERGRYALMSHWEKVIHDTLVAAVPSDARRVAAAPWSDSIAARPINDVQAMKRRLREKGILANQLVINHDDFLNIRNSEQVIDRIAGQGAGAPSTPEDINAQALARLFSIDEVVVASALANTANIARKAVFEDIWTQGTVIMHQVARGRDLRVPCSGRLIHWRGDGSDIDGMIETYREEDTRSDIVRIRNEAEAKIMHAEAIQSLDIS